MSWCYLVSMIIAGYWYVFFLQSDLLMRSSSTSSSLPLAFYICPYADFFVEELHYWTIYL